MSSPSRGPDGHRLGQRPGRGHHGDDRTAQCELHLTLPVGLDIGSARDVDRGAGDLVALLVDHGHGDGRRVVEPAGFLRPERARGDQRGQRDEGNPGRRHDDGAA